MTGRDLRHGIRENLAQVSHQLIQVMLVGFAIGMTRTVVPALAESEFGLERGSFLLLASFVVAFGAVKAVMNFVAGRWSERIGRKRVLFWGWIVALPIPVMIWHAPDWNWIVAATVLLGVNSGPVLVDDADIQARHHECRGAGAHHGAERVLGLCRRGDRRHRDRLCRRVAGGTDGVAGLRYGSGPAGAVAHRGLGQGHPAMGQGRDGGTQSCTSEIPAALPAGTSPGILQRARFSR